MSILETVEHVIGTISNTVWPVFLPLVMIVGLFLIIRTFTVIQPATSKPAKVDAAHIVGPAVISLGAMIGTGAIIGVLGSCSKLVGAGQVQLEALAIWALIVLFPFYWMVMTSFKSYSAYNGEFIPRLYTLAPTLQNYLQAFTGVRLGDYFVKIFRACS